MKITKTTNKKYPRKVTFDNKHISPVPDQRQFKNNFIRSHGCSIAAFYIALRFCGKKKRMGAVLKYSKKHLKKYMKSKLTIKGVAVGLNRQCGRKVAKYHKKASLKAINKALDAGRLVLLETGSPIHTNVIYRVSGKTYHLDHGKVKRISAAKLVARATKSATYRGWVDVRG